MSPLKINMLLHFYAIAEPYHNIDAPAQKEALEEFKREGLIYYDVESQLWRTTTRGDFYVKQLFKIQYPAYKEI